MPKNVILFVGLEKTGTTWVQRAFEKSYSKLREVGILYPDIRSGSRRFFHSSLAAALVPSGANEFLPTDERVGPDSLSQLYNILDSMDFDALVLHSEHFSSRLDSGSIDRLLNVFKASGLTITVVIYLREHQSFVRSAYSTMLISGGVRSITEFVGSAINRDCYFDYLTKIGLWEGSGFDCNVLVRSYDEVVRKSDLIADVESIVNRFSRSPVALTRPQGLVNPSLSNIVLFFGQEINKMIRLFGTESPPNYQVLRHLSQKLVDPYSQFLEYEEICALSRAFSEDYSIINNRYFPFGGGLSMQLGEAFHFRRPEPAMAMARYLSMIN